MTRSGAGLRFVPLVRDGVATARRARALLLAASPWRAVMETLALAGTVVGAALLLGASLPYPRFLRLDYSLLLLAGPCAAAWCAMRMRMAVGSWWGRVWRDLLIGGILGVLPGVVAAATGFALAVAPGVPASVRSATIRGFPVVWFAWLALPVLSIQFVACRIGVRLWLYWDRLRRTRLRWALTHAHLLVVVIGAALLGLLEVIARTTGGDGAQLPFELLRIVVFGGFITVVALVVVLSPSALFSYLFARPTTRRLEALAAATTALSAGYYGVRVPVSGEDEVASLQANFNAMAEDLERAVRELREQRDTVSTLLAARRELVANVSHELRTPVATLRGYLESTLAHWDGEPPDTLRHDLAVMERETVHLQALINDLFALARAEVGSLDLCREPVDARAASRRVVEVMAPLAWQANRVEVVLADADADISETDDAPIALADGERLGQVLRNLLHNAVRHTPPGGIVAVATASDGPTVTIEVRDTGEGIAPDELPHIWERFYRGAGGRVRTDGGSGLGLALVKELIEAMGGAVGVASVPGEGSRFTIRLPRP
ncbi:MAG TPA: ATP-binding protein [Ktedonobacterales bacterium]